MNKNCVLFIAVIGVISYSKGQDSTSRMRYMEDVHRVSDSIKNDIEEFTLKSRLLLPERSATEPDRYSAIITSRPLRASVWPNARSMTVERQPERSFGISRPGSRSGSRPGSSVNNFNFRMLAVIPSIYGMRDYVSYVGDQRYIFSCAAWSVASLKTIEDNLANKQKYTDATRDNPSNHYSPSFIYSIVKSEIPDSNCKKGIDLIEALAIVKSKGIVSLKYLPYYRNDFRCCENIAPSIYDSAKVHKLKRFSAVKLNILDFQYVLSHNSPIAVDVSINDEFLSKGLGGTWSKDTPFIWKEYGDLTLRRIPHAMLCIGYSDNIGAFLMVNSHGKQFGDKGFFWIDYQFMFDAVSSAYYSVSEEYQKQESDDVGKVQKVKEKIQQSSEKGIIKLREGDGNKNYLGVKWECIYVNVTQQIAHLKIYKPNGNVIRVNMPVGLETGTYFTFDSHNYLVKLTDIQVRNSMITGSPLPPEIDIQVVKLPAGPDLL